MSTFFPDPLPTWVRDNPFRAAEVHVYDALHRDLASRNDFDVYYSRPWHGTAPDGTEKDGEADFVIAHPDYGILVVEVKGGQVTEHADEGIWRSTNRHGHRFRIKDPFKQATSSMHELLRRLKDVRSLSGRYIPALHAVIFPDGEPTGIRDTLESREFAYATGRDIQTLGTWIESRMAMAKEGRHYQPFGEDGREALHRLLAEGIEIRATLGTELASTERAIIRLTEEQFHVLDSLDANRRMSISGAAGTGKTVLAVEKARRLSTLGVRTLLTCYNSALAGKLGREFDGADNPVVGSFHSVAREIANSAGVGPAAASDDPEYDTTVLPNAFREAMEQRPDLRFDAIVVDEGQDFRPEWWNALLEALADPERGHFYVFHDDNQRLYDWTAPTFLDMPGYPYRLTRNLRNTRQIFDAVRLFYGGPPPLRAAGPDGPEIERVKCSGAKDCTRTVKEIVRRLVEEDGIEASEIAVLSARGRMKSDVIRALEKSDRDVCSASRPRDGMLIVDTIRRFKGLDSRVVVLCELENAVNEPELQYVGLSRARGQVILADTQEVLSQIATSQGT